MSQSYLPVNITDTTVPYNISFISPTESNNAILNRSYIRYNVSAKDNGVISKVYVYLYNSGSVLINSSFSTNSTFWGNFSGLNDGEYYLNASVNDTYGNVNASETRHIALYTTVPDITLYDPDDTETVRYSVCNFTFKVESDVDIEECDLIINSNVSSTMYEFEELNQFSKSLSNGKYNWSINCTDEVGNIGSSVKRSFTVNTSSSSVTTGTGSNNSSNSSNTNSSINSTIIEILNSTLEQGSKQIVGIGDKMKFNLSNESHQIEIKNLTNTSIKITVSSTPQEATILIGAEKKFELDGDSYNDLYVKLNSITNSKANLTIQKIHEAIASSTTSTGNKTSTTSTNKTTEPKKGMFVLIGIIVLIFGGSLVGVLLVLKKIKSSKKEESKVNNPVFSEGSEPNPNGQIYQPRY